MEFNILKTLLVKLHFILCIVLLNTACTTNYPNKSILGEQFIAVKGKSLEQQVKEIPSAFTDEKTLLLLGYVQDSQFDIDRWLIGLDMVGAKIVVYELPAIQGMFPRFFETQINNGMRKGIPKPLWKGVITLYEDGEKLQQFTGNINPNNARVVLLDATGKIEYFYDAGFSVNALNLLIKRIGS